MRQIKDGDVLWGKIVYIADLSLGPCGRPSSRTKVVRVSIPRGGDVSLTVKTYWLLSKGTPEVGHHAGVQFTLSPRSGVSKWKIISLSDPKTQTLIKDEPVSNNHMSKDRVRFFLGYTYYSNNNEILRMATVLGKAFGLDHVEAVKIMQTYTDGVWIVCRPSQFARFLIYRNAAAIKNGFMDLRAELFSPPPKQDSYTMLAEVAGVDREDAKRVVLALSYSADWVGKNMKKMRAAPTEIDVSGNSAHVL